jgi:hypothetical protein
LQIGSGQIVGREPVISGRGTPTLLDLVEGPFDQVACAVQIRAKADQTSVFSKQSLSILAVCRHVAVGRFALAATCVKRSASPGPVYKPLAMWVYF